MKICAVCITYNRPELLARLLACFNQQTHPDRFLYILDDAGQYHQQEGDGWKLESLSKRFPTLAEKRNYAVSQAKKLFHPEALAVWDDDDYYYPWALASTAFALQCGQWAQPSQVLEVHTGQITRHYTFREEYPHLRFYHGGWAFLADVFPFIEYYGDGIGEDSRLREDLRAAYGESIDTICFRYPQPFYVYHRRGGLSAGGRQRGQARYLARGKEPVSFTGILQPCDGSPLLTSTIPTLVQPFPW